MIISFVLWFLLTAFVFIIGHGCSKLLEENKLIPKPNIELKFILGFFFTSIVLCVGTFKEIIFLILITTFAIFFRDINWKELKRHLRIFQTKKGIVAVSVFSVYALTLLISAADLVRDYDAYLYHLQSIHWLSTHPLTIGLVNLHQRLAFQSVWFNWSSFFGLDTFLGYPLSYLNSWIFLILFAWIIKLFFLEKNKLVSLVYLIFPALILAIASDGPLFRILRGYNPDVPAIATSIFILLFQFRKQSDFAWLFTILLTSIIGVWLKVSLLPFFIVSFIFFLSSLIKKTISKPQIMLSFISIIIFFGLYFGFNFFKSGNVLYPLPATHIPVTWSEEKNDTRRLNVIISNWAKRQLHDEKRNSFDWIASWHNSLSASERNLLLISTISFIVIVVQAGIEKSAKYLKLAIILGTIFCYWFLLAPDFRFGLGIILGTIFSGLIILMKSKANVTLKVFFFLFTTISIILTNKTLVNYPAWAKMVPQVSPWGLQQFPTQSIIIKSKQYFVPQSETEDRTDYQSFPSAPFIHPCLNQINFGPILIFNQRCD